MLLLRAPLPSYELVGLEAIHQMGVYDVTSESRGRRGGSSLRGLPRYVIRGNREYTRPADVPTPIRQMRERLSRPYTAASRVRRLDRRRAVRERRSDTIVLP